MYKRGKSIFSKDLSRSKRGISPLIATVLLIAFAVSIGTMIMNWGKDAVAVGDCSETKIEPQVINGKQLFCYDTLNNKVTVMVKNVGSTNIDSLKMRVITPDFNFQDVDVSDSNIKSGDVKTKNIDFTKSGTFRVEITPVITFGGKEKICSEKYIYVDNIPSCN